VGPYDSGITDSLQITLSTTMEFNYATVVDVSHAAEVRALVLPWCLKIEMPRRALIFP
jgi:hypothetical protein